MFEQLQGHVHHGGGAHRLHLELGRTGKLQEVLDDGVHVADLIADDLKVLLLIDRQGQGAVEREKAHLDGGERIADAVGHAGGQLADHGHLLALQEVFAALGQLALGLVHILDQILDAAMQGGHDVLGVLRAGLLAGGLGQALERPQDPHAQDEGQQPGAAQADEKRGAGDQSQAKAFRAGVCGHAVYPLGVLGLVLLAKIQDGKEMFAHRGVEPGSGITLALTVKGDDLVLGGDVALIFLVDLGDARLEGRGVGQAPGLFEAGAENLTVLAELAQPVGIAVQKVVGHEPLLADQGGFQPLGGIQGGHASFGDSGQQLLHLVGVPDHDPAPEQVQAHQGRQGQVKTLAQTGARAHGGSPAGRCAEK